MAIVSRTRTCWATGAPASRLSVCAIRARQRAAVRESTKYNEAFVDLRAFLYNVEAGSTALAPILRACEAVLHRTSLRDGRVISMANVYALEGQLAAKHARARTRPLCCRGSVASFRETPVQYKQTASHLRLLLNNSPSSPSDLRIMLMG